MAVKGSQADSCYVVVLQSAYVATQDIPELAHKIAQMKGESTATVLRITTEVPGFSKGKLTVKSFATVADRSAKDFTACGPRGAQEDVRGRDIQFL